MNAYIEGLLPTGEVFAPPSGVSDWFPIPDQAAFVRAATADPVGFWNASAGHIAWTTAPTLVFDGSISDQHWFADGRLNATVSCLDRHVHTHPHGIAYDFIREDGVEQSITYAELLARVNQLANALDFEPFCDNVPSERDATIVSAEHPLFILYTSGTTGGPKGVVMNHGGYLVGASTMLRLTTGVAPGEITWCTSDIGWIVGHTVIVYGALANCYRKVLREGSPDYPTPGAVYDVIARHAVRTLSTAPTLARMLMRLGPDLAERYDLTSLRAIFCAGEPLNSEAWHCLYNAIGNRRAAVCNQWWQTELAAPSIGFFPSTPIHPDRSGTALGPLVFSVRDGSGAPESSGRGGLLVLETPAPYMFAGIWGDPERHADYFRPIAGVIRRATSPFSMTRATLPC